MKKIIRVAALLLALVLAAALFGCGRASGPADDGPETDAPDSETVRKPAEEKPSAASEFVWKYDDSGALWLDAYVGGDETVEIPDEDPETGTKVTGIDVWAFRDNTRVKKITVPDTVKTVGKCAFMNCTSLETVDFPRKLDSIGDQAFYRCTSLKRIVIPEGVTKIGYATFMFCESLEEIVLPSTLKEIGTLAMARCVSVQTVGYAGSEEKWTSVAITNGAMPPTWYNIIYNYIT